MGSTIIKLNRKNVRSEILKGAEIHQEVKRVANEIAAHAGPRFSVFSAKHTQRDVATVIDTSADALRIEAEQGNLTRALGMMGVARRFGRKR